MAQTLAAVYIYIYIYQRFAQNLIMITSDILTTWQKTVRLFGVDLGGEFYD